MFMYFFYGKTIALLSKDIISFRLLKFMQKRTEHIPVPFGEKALFRHMQLINDLD